MSNDNGRENFLGSYYDFNSNRNKVDTIKIPVTTNKEDIMVKLEINNENTTMCIDYNNVDVETAVIVMDALTDIVLSYSDDDIEDDIDIEDELIDLRTCIEYLIANNQAAIIKYKDNEGSLSIREILPEEIRENSTGSTTVIAHCFLKGAYRSFNIENIIGLYLKL